MKRVFYTAMLLCAAFAVSCSSDMPDDSRFESATEGLLNISFDVPAADTRAYQSGDACDIRFYKYDDDSKLSKSLIRHYYSETELPESLWLLVGEYCVTVSIGNRQTVPAATFDGGSIYYGEEDFTITAGQTTGVEVNCGIRNTMVKVIYDKSLYDKFNIAREDAVTGFQSRYCTTVVVSDAWDPDFKAHGLPYLAYKRQEMTNNGENEFSRVGYFWLPEGAKKISYCFHAFSTDKNIEGYDPDNSNQPVNGEVHMHHTKSLDIPAGMTTREGVMYTLTFKYSPDVNGFIKVDFDVAVKDIDERDDTKSVNPEPKPKLDGNGFSKDETYTVTGQTLSYKAEHVKPIDRIEIFADNRKQALATIDCKESSEKDGIKVERELDGLHITLTFTAEFLNKLSGGEHTLLFRTTAGSGVDSEVLSRIRMSGAYSLESTDRWNAKGELRAYVYDSAQSDVKIQYRAVGGTGTWTTVEAKPGEDGEDNIYKADCSDINANTEYEYQLLLDSAEVGAAVKTQIGDGWQIPNSGFEIWSGSLPLLPYIDGEEQWWDTGNHGSRMASVNVTKNVTTNPHSGKYCAELKSQKATIMGMGKFAAGNIFVGKYGGTNIPNGLIGFGKPLEFKDTYRPKAIRFWYRGTVGTIDERDNTAPADVKKGNSDVAQFYCMLCKMDGPHIVDTRYSTTFMNFEISTISYCTGVLDKNSTNDKDDGLVIGVATWEKTQTEITKTDGKGGHTTEPTVATIDEWTVMTVPINYNSENPENSENLENSENTPTYILVTASSSKYGDYFTGSTESLMYLDDVELVY